MVACTQDSVFVWTGWAVVVERSRIVKYSNKILTNKLLCHHVVFHWRTLKRLCVIFWSIFYWSALNWYILPAIRCFSSRCRVMGRKGEYGWVAITYGWRWTRRRTGFALVSLQWLLNLIRAFWEPDRCLHQEQTTDVRFLCLKIWTSLWDNCKKKTFLTPKWMRMCVSLLQDMQETLGWFMIPSS